MLKMHPTFICPSIHKNISVLGLDGGLSGWWGHILLITDSLWAEVANTVLIPTHQFFNALRKYWGWGCCFLAQQELVDFSQNLSRSSLTGEGQKGRSVMLIHMLTAGFWNICSVSITLASGESIPCHQLNPNLLLGGEGRTLSVGHHLCLSLKKTQSQT